VRDGVPDGDGDEVDLAAYVLQVAHDVRTPLTAIRGYADVLLQQGDDLPVLARADLLARIVSNAVRMEEQITAMTLLARPPGTS
jgi:signal transduction histidine kinase